MALTLMILCIGIFTNSLTAEDIAGVTNEATIKGKVIDITPEQNTIFGVRVTAVDTAGNKYTTQTNEKGEYEIKGLAAGRYTLSYTKDGYGDRVGKTKILAEGREIFERIKMRKQKNFFMIYPQGWIFLIVAAVVMTVVFILLFLHLRDRGI